MKWFFKLLLGCGFVLVVYAGEHELPLPGNDIVGENYTIIVSKGDSLTSIRQKHSVSYDELLEANPNIDFYKLKIGQEIVIPKQFILPVFREGVVINVPELRMYYFDSGKVYTFPVGLGRKHWRTPLFSTKVVNKKARPNWHVPASIRDYVYKETGKVLPNVVEPGPNNPLGDYAIYLGINSYLIHGTNVPSTVGAFVSSGCVRMLRDPLELLFNKIKVGTPVKVVYHPIKAGWLGNNLYLEVHKGIDYYENIENKKNKELSNFELEKILDEVIKEFPVFLDEDMLQKVLEEHLGIPKIVGHRLD